MKRKLGWLLTVLLMGAMMAAGCRAEGWEEGRSAEKPYQGVPAAEFSENIGYMIMYPSRDTTVDASIMQLFVYLPREDVRAGEGTLYLCSEEEGMEMEIAFNDSRRVIERAMTEEELSGLLWGSGTCFEVRLARSLELNKSYFINMTADCIVAPSYGNGNLEIGGTETWRFDTKADYGISRIALMDASGADEEPEWIAPESAKAGDALTFQLDLSGNAVAASVFCPEEILSLQDNYFEESCTITADILATGAASLGVVFFDEKGEMLDHILLDVVLGEEG